MYINIEIFGWLGSSFSRPNADSSGFYVVPISRSLHPLRNELGTIDHVH